MTSRGRGRTLRSFPDPDGMREKQAATEVLQRAVGAWDKFELSPDEFVEQGDTAVVPGHTPIWRRASGLPA
jgi:hypothetical protein